MRARGAAQLRRVASATGARSIHVLALCSFAPEKNAARSSLLNGSPRPIQFNPPIELLPVWIFSRLLSQTRLPLAPGMPSLTIPTELMDLQREIACHAWWLGFQPPRVIWLK